MAREQGAPDEGAFSFLPSVESDKLRDVLRGLEFRATKLLLRDRRKPADWTGALLVGIHRDVFGKFFPEHAGICRRGEALFGDRAGPAPEQLDALLQQVVIAIRSHLVAVQSEPDPEVQAELAFMYAAIDHAEMLRIHPFIDGNGRWARIVTSAFLYDCGFPVGSIVRKAGKAEYVAALNRCMDNNEPGDLANILLRGYLDVLKRRNQQP